jgi:hypothetical protein
MGREAAMPEHEAVPPADSADIYGYHCMPHASEERAGDYPLSSMCARCGAPIIKPAIPQPWRHRTDADVIDGPAYLADAEA